MITFVRTPRSKKLSGFLEAIEEDGVDDERDPLYLITRDDSRHEAERMLKQAEGSALEGFSRKWV